MTTKAINNTVNDIVLSINRTIPGSGELEIDRANFPAFAESDIWTHIAAGDVDIESSGETLSMNDSINHLKGFYQKIPTDTSNNPTWFYPAFAAKKLPDGSKLFKRLHGQLESLSVGSNTIIFTITYNHVKMIGTRIVGGEMGDYCSFKILDDGSGNYAGGDPYAVLNQYGFSACIEPNGHQEVCRYDADLYIGMVVEFTYNSVSAKTVGFNFDMSEVVPPS